MCALLLLGLSAAFAGIATALEEKEQAIVGELNGAQGKAVNIGGYYRPDGTLTAQAMRPSATFNAIVDGITA